MICTADGERLLRDDGESVTLYMPQVELTWDRSSGELDATRYFTHAGQVVATCTGQDVADWTWLGVDHHGTTTTHAVNAFTAVEQVRRLDPYGNPRGTPPPAWPGQRTFAGGVQDPTGLIHIGARSYDPTTGRFISADPILDPTDDQQINGYAYAHNNPISATDPTGMRDYWNSVNGTACIDGDCSYHNPNGSLKNPNQCKATGGCGRGPGTSTASAGSKADSTAPSRQPTNIVNEILEHGTTYVLRNDGRIVLNGIVLPAGAPPGAELAPLVDQAIFENDLRPDEVLLAVSWLCDAWVIECDKDFMTATWTSDVAQGLGADNMVEMLAIGGALSLVAQFPGAAGGRIGSGGRTTCRNSFEAGTLVLMADGSHSPIEDIEPGDLVLATAPETGRTEPQPVVATITGHGDKSMVDVTIASCNDPVATTVHTALNKDNRADAEAAVLTTTDDHPFWVTEQAAWVGAEDLRPGDRLLNADGTYVTIRAVTVYRAASSVYNLTVAELHTYYALADGTPVPVHNQNGSCGAAPFGGGGLKAPKASSYRDIDAGTYKTRQQALDAASRDIMNYRYSSRARSVAQLLAMCISTYIIIGVSCSRLGTTIIIRDEKSCPPIVS